MEKTLVFKSKPLMTLMSLHAKESQHLRRERRRRRRRSAIKQYQCDLNQRKTTASLPAQLNPRKSVFVQVVRSGIWQAAAEARSKKQEAETEADQLKRKEMKFN